MSTATNQFLEAAGQAAIRDPQAAPKPVNTFMRLCPGCLELMPHVRKGDYSECVICGHRTYRHTYDHAEAGSN